MKKKFVIFSITLLVVTVLASCSHGYDEELYSNGSHDYPPSESLGGAPQPGANADPGELITREELSPSSEVISIISFDGYNLQGRLTLPGNERIDKLVIFVNPTGPHTFDARRNFGDRFSNLNDFYALRFQERGIAFFSYSTRGVGIGGEFPHFHTIDETRFLTHLPANQVRDIYYMINAIRAMDARLENSQIILWGRSEGAIIAPMFAELYPHMVDALILISVPIDNMYDVIKWRFSGEAYMVWYRHYFNTDNYGRISREAFEADPNNVIEREWGEIEIEALFDMLDENNNGFIDVEDYYLILEPWRLELFRALDTRNNLRLRDLHHPRITAEWFWEHSAIQSNMYRLPTLDLPIFIFHYTLDQIACVNRVIALEEKLAQLGRTNISVNIIEGFDHNRNFAHYLMTYEEALQGLQAAFETVFYFNMVR